MSCMHGRLVLFLIGLFIAILPSTSSQSARILNHPMAINISVNEEAVMSCTVNGDHINWKINGEPLVGDEHAGLSYSYQSIIFDEAANKRMGQLTIKGLNTTSNGTMVTCVASQLRDSLFSVAVSEPALILVQGTLDAVTNLNISTSNYVATAIISWDRPANFLNGINIDYQVEVATCSYTYIANYSNTTLHHDLPHRNVSHSVKVKAVTNAGDGEAKTHAVNLPNYEIQLVSAHAEAISTTMATTTTTTATTLDITTTATATVSNGSLASGDIIVISIITFLIVTAVIILVSAIVAIIFVGCVDKNRNLTPKSKYELGPQQPINKQYNHETIPLLEGSYH